MLHLHQWKKGPTNRALWAPTRKTKLRTRCAAQKSDVVIVGAGIAGLTCALQLQKNGISFDLVEAQDDVGGRVRTDIVDGFLLDRGFQIFLTAYPEAIELLDYEDLKLKQFYAGANVYFQGQFHKVADPLRHPLDGIKSLGNPIGTVLDKVLIGLYRAQAYLKQKDAILQAEEDSIHQHLQDVGFTESIISSFFKPFLGGIFFDRDLNTTSRLFEFVMKMLATGSNCLPEKGIGAVSQQLYGKLPSNSVHLNAKVTKVDLTQEEEEEDSCISVYTLDGAQFRGAHVVLATEGPVASELLGDDILPKWDRPGRGGSDPDCVGTVCLYFRADDCPSEEPILYLNGNGDGSIVNNCCFPSTVSSSYAPEGKTLVSVSLVGNYTERSEEELVDTVKEELAGWFGSEQVHAWEFLRMYRIPYAQPNQNPPTDFFRDIKLRPGVFVCGDHRDCATLDGALRSGKRTAEAIIKDIQSVHH